VELAKELLRKRIEAVGGEGTYPFDGHRIATLVKHAKGNPSTLLQSAKEKSIRLSVDQRDKIIAEQIERIRAREQAIKQKYLANKERKREEKEQKRLAIEKEREERMEAEERKRVQEIKHHEKILASEDMQLGKIDDMIGSILGGKGKAKEEKEVKEDTSELDKHKELVEKAVGNVPEEKNADQILKEDPSLLDDLKLVLEETEEATKHKKKKRRSK
jgi:hypothetical protein